MVVGVAGLGLIGASLAKAASRAGHDVLVWNRTRKVAERAVAEGFAKGILGEGGQPLSSCDMVWVALPPLKCAPWVAAHAGEFRKGAVVCDAAGVKGAVMEELKPFALGCGWSFVGAHPMAGRERGGYENSTADLFIGAPLVLTPWPSLGRAPLDMIESFAHSIGFAKIVYATPAHHDEMIAYTSQLCHAVSFAGASDPHYFGALDFAGGSFQDMTRISASDPGMWADLFIANREAFAAAAGRLADRLKSMCEAALGRDRDALKSILDEGHRG